MFKILTSYFLLEFIVTVFIFFIIIIIILIFFFFYSQLALGSFFEDEGDEDIVTLPQPDSGSSGSWSVGPR